MKPIAALTLTGLVCASQAVYAASTFDGFYVGAGLGLRGTSSKLTEPASGAEIDGIGNNNLVGDVLAGYSFSPNGSFNIAGNVWYNFGDSTTSVSVSGLGLDYKLRNTYGLSLEPGWYLGTNTLGYVKASYARTTGEFSDGFPSQRENFNGFGYGVGVKQLLTSNMYLYVEAEQRIYGTQTYSNLGIDMKPKETLGTVGVGWTFR